MFDFANKSLEEAKSRIYSLPDSSERDEALEKIDDIFSLIESMKEKI